MALVGLLYTTTTTLQLTTPSQLVVRVQRTARKRTEKGDARVKLLVLTRSVLFYTVGSLP